MKTEFKKSELKALIHEVLREMSATEDPKDNQSPESEVDFTKNTTAAQKHGDEMEVKLSVRGVKAGGALKKFLAQLSANAIASDWAVLRAEMEKSGIKVASMSEDDLTKVATHAGKPELAPKQAETEKDIKNISPTTWKKMSPEERDKYIKQGSHSAEWQAATDKDMEDTRAKAKLKAAKIAAGTYDPEDTSLWTDKEWDAWNAGQDAAQTYDTGKSAGKYKPNLSKKTAKGVKGAVKAGFSDTLR